MPSLIPYKKRKLTPIDKAKEFLVEHKDLAPSLVIILILFFAYGALAIWEARLSSELETIRENNEILISGSKVRQSNEVKDFALKTRLLGELMDSQRQSTDLFSEFEGSTHKQINISSFNLDTKKNTLSLVGSTQSLEALGQQLIIWSNDSLYINKATIESFARREGGIIDFSAELELDQDLFKKGGEDASNNNRLPN